MLTGREERLDAGFALLAAGLGARLLVSGVGEGADHVQLARVRAGDPALYDARVELDEASASTAENARAAAAWADGQDARRLLVVSSAWHLPRGLVLLGRAAPEATLTPAPAPAPWPWPDLPLEWAKFLWVRLQPAAP